MKKSILVTLTFVWASLVGTSYAVEGTWFGPIGYQRTRKQPNVYTATFPAMPGRGTLLVKNGGRDGTRRVSSALILVNGREILGPSDFSQRITGKSSSINLGSHNSVTVVAAGKPGDYLTVQVVQEIGWLFFHEGDPGTPGDGVFAEGVLRAIRGSIWSRPSRWANSKMGLQQPFFRRSIHRLRTSCSILSSLPLATDRMTNAGSGSGQAYHSQG